MLPSVSSAVVAVHVLAAVSMVSGSVLARVLKHNMHQTRDAGELRALLRAYGYVPVLVMPGLAIAVATGAYLAWSRGYGLLQPWLVASYVVLAASLVAVGTSIAPAMDRATATLEASPADGAAVRAIIGTPRVRWASLVADGGNFVVMLLMLFKPGM